MKINIDNRMVHKFMPVDGFGEGGRIKLEKLYSLSSLDVNQFLGVLSPIASKIVWVPSNGKWRCAVIFTTQYHGQISIFFPFIMLSGDKKGKLIGTVDVGKRGVVAHCEISEVFCQVCNVFEQKIYPCN